MTIGIGKVQPSFPTATNWDPDQTTPFKRLEVPETRVVTGIPVTLIGTSPKPAIVSVDP